jgi:Complex1_LYR-like
MGNLYLRDEFRRHKAAKTEFVAPFLKEWTQYKDTLKQQLSASSSAVGNPMDSELLSDMTDEQIRQLYELKKAAKGEDVEMK